MAMNAMRALGLMSGTSMDGVDGAIVVTDGHDILDFGVSSFEAFSPENQNIIRNVQGEWPHDTNAQKAAEAVVLAAHDAVINQFTDVDVIGFHGQTLAHDPAAGRTFQLGNGEKLNGHAPIVWDFRSKDMAFGGEGAPLAPFFHHACARWAKLRDPVVFLNLGGVGNVTWVDPSAPDPADSSALLAFDTGPANALLNDFMMIRRGVAYDDNGDLAKMGRVDAGYLAGYAAEYFDRLPPKSLDRNDFQDVLAYALTLSDADGAATLAAFTVEAVARAIRYFPHPPTRWLVCGGGRHNVSIMKGLSEEVYVPVEPVEAVGLDGDMLEAQAFGYLAVRVLRGLPTSSPQSTGCSKPVCGGRIFHR